MKKKTKKRKSEASERSPSQSASENGGYLMKIGRGERLYKVFFFRPIAGREWHFEYRIMTKEKSNGMLEMVSYSFKTVSGSPVKSGVMRVPELSKRDLESIVQNMVKRTNTGDDEFEELDLSCFSNLEEQIEFLKAHDRADTMYIT